MAYTVDDFKRETFDLLIQDLGPLTPEQPRLLLERMNVQDLLRGLDPEELRKLQEYLKTMH